MADNYLISELKNARRWVCWKAKALPGGKSTKIPYSPTPKGGKASTTNSGTWGTYEEAQKTMAADNYSGVGYVLGKEEAYICIDLDHCLDRDSHKISDEKAKAIVNIIKESGGTYTEISPSGDGIHIWGKARLPENEKGIEKGIHASFIEMYRQGRYITVTGNALNNEPVKDIQKAVDRILQKYNLVKQEAPAPATVLKEALPETDEEVINRIRKSKDGPAFSALYDKGDCSPYGDDQSRADQALMNKFAFWTNGSAEQMERLFLSSKLAETLDRKKGHSKDYLERTISAALQWLKEHGGGYDPEAYAAQKRAEELKQAFQDDYLSKDDTQAPLGMDTDPTGGDSGAFDKLLTYLAKHLTDSDNAARLVKQFGHKFIYCGFLGKWLKYTGRKWAAVDSVEVQEAAGKTARIYAYHFARLMAEEIRKGLFSENDQKQCEKVLKALNNAQNDRPISSAVKIARGKHFIYPEKFDNEPFLLNCDNGVLNLKTMEMIPHESAQRFMKCAAAAYTGQEHSTLWRDTVQRLLPDPETRRYVQKMAGYFLTGSVKEEKLFFLYGASGTGKSTFIEQLGKVLGDYVIHLPPEVFLTSKYGQDGNAPTPYKAMMKGARLSISNESEIGRTFKDSDIKSLTGGDKITGRLLHSNPIAFSPTHKIVFVSNYRPHIRDISKAGGMYRRLVIIPFNASFRPDPDLKDQLARPENLADTLLWMVEGCQLWAAEGLGTVDQAPPEIKKELSQYYEDNDTLGNFIEERCLLGPEYSDGITNLYKAYRDFLQNQYGQYISSSKRTFVELLLNEYPQLKRGKSGSTRKMKGIVLTENKDRPENFSAPYSDNLLK